MTLDTMKRGTMRLGLGTAQFGMAYGLASQSRQVPGRDVPEILAAAREFGVTTLDTAPAYGVAEAALGEAQVADFEIVTKVSRIPRHRIDPNSWVKRSLRTSLQRLRVPRVYGLLAHHAPDLYGPHGTELLSALREAKESGATKKIGASVYTAHDLDRLLDLGLDLVQVPINALDQRLVRSGHIGRLREMGIEVHARSLLLQGLLILDPQRLPTHLAGLTPALLEWHTAIREAGLTPLRGAVAFARGVQGLDRAIFGVTSRSELTEIVESLSAETPVGLFENLGPPPEHLVNPANWGRAR